MTALERFRKIFLAAGVIGLLAVLPGALARRPAALEGYLIGFLFWTGLSVGSLGILMLHHLAGGRWGLLIRRPLEAAASALPVLAALFIPIALGLSGLYEWAVPAAADDHHIHKIAAYLNRPFFLVRAALYFAVWSGLAILLRRASIAEDAHAGDAAARSMRRVSAPGLILLVLTVTFAATDWTMSLDPHWFSTVYGATVLVGHGAGAIAGGILIAAFLRDDELLRRAAAPDRFLDLGNLMLAFVMFWAYLSYSQFLLIWSANIPEETAWYIARKHGLWPAYATALATIHFFLPFLILLSRQMKKSPSALAAVAGVVFAARWFDVVWLVSPSTDAGFSGILWGAAATAGIGGLWLWWFATRLAARPIVPVGDPRLAEEAA